MRYVWTLDEIIAKREPDGGGIWFYGLVRDDTGIRLAEIFPGTGYAYAWPYPLRSLRAWLTAFSDIRLAEARRGR